MYNNCCKTPPHELTSPHSALARRQHQRLVNCRLYQNAQPVLYTFSQITQNDA
jgi:hypothetical protein